MKRPFLSTMLICISLSYASMVPALAADGCTQIYNDGPGHYRLGEFQIGTPILQTMTPDELQDCLERTSAPLEDGVEDGEICNVYFDKFGAEIATEANTPLPIERQFVGRISAYPSHYAGTLIAGADWGDDLQTVLAKLATLPKTFPEWRIESKPLKILSTGPCLRSIHGSTWTYVLYFDQDYRLSGADAYMDYKYTN